MRITRIALLIFALVCETHRIGLAGGPDPQPSANISLTLLPLLLLVIVMFFLFKIRKNSLTNRRGLLFPFSIPQGLFRLIHSFASSKAESLKANFAPETAKAAPRMSSYSKGGVFISYRREDSADITGRIYDRLVQHFSKEIVFKDVDSIPLGIDFRKHLENALSQCQVLVAVIGENWIESETSSGNRRIDSPRDHLRIEIEIALHRDIPVVPVLVRNATMPAEDQLPPSLQSLAYRNGIPIRPDPDFHTDMDRLIKGIEVHLENLE